LIFVFFLQEANKPPDSWFELKVNTHVYVTGLPHDVTAEEVVCFLALHKHKESSFPLVRNGFFYLFAHTYGGFPPFNIKKMSLLVGH
jgi:hypothetical protein